MHSSKIGSNYNKSYVMLSNYSSSLSNLKLRLLFKNKVSEKQLSLIAANLAQLYKDGITIVVSLELVADTISNKAYKNSLFKILKDIKQGKSLSEGFAGFKDLYPDFFIGICSIGENTGKLYEVLKGLSIYYDKALFIKREIKNASAYPIFILISMFILSIFFLNKVIPNFCDIYNSMDIELPANCKFLYDINLIVKSNPILVLIGSISWLSVLIILFRQFRNRLRADMFIKISIVRLFFEYIMILLFSIITSTGINISHALEYCEDSINFIYLRRKIGEINSNILKGKSLTDSLEMTNIFSKYTLAVVKIHEEAGTIDDGFKELSNNLENNLYGKIKKYLNLISPIFVIIMSGFILMFLLGFVLPLFDNLKSGIR